MNGPRTVLIVDDELPVRSSLRALLDDEFNVVLCSDGTEALRFVSDHPGEVFAAFVDFVMPDMNGASVCIAIRDLDPTISLVGFSGRDDASFVAPLFAQFVKNERSFADVPALAANAVRLAAQKRHL